MMPGHANAPRWKEIGSELMVSAYVLEGDLKSESVVDGKPVKDWLQGYHVRADGAMINHHILHPDYMTCVKFNLQAHNLQSLAGQTVPEAADFRAEFIWTSMPSYGDYWLPSFKCRASVRRRLARIRLHRR